jgi:chromosome partitioning protein
MPIIAVANQKGGAGKTTCCVNLAGGLAEAGYGVLVVDADPQASALNWRNNAGEDSKLGFDVIALPSPSLHRDIPGILKRSSYEVVLIDCPPGGVLKGSRTDDITRSAMLAAHVVLIPVQPSPLDYQAAATMLPLLRDTVLYKPELKVWILVNRRLSGNNRLGRDARSSAESFFAIEGLEISVLKTSVGARSALAECAGVGQTILTYDGGSIAALEFRNLTEEVVACLATPSAIPASLAG